RPPVRQALFSRQRDPFQSEKPFEEVGNRELGVGEEGMTTPDSLFPTPLASAASGGRRPPPRARRATHRPTRTPTASSGTAPGPPPRQPLPLPDNPGAARRMPHSPRRATDTRSPVARSGPRERAPERAALWAASSARTAARGLTST